VVVNLWSLIIEYYAWLEELDGDPLICKAYEQSKYLASCGMCSWYHYMAQGLRQISNRFEFESTSWLTDSLKELNLQQWISNLQKGGTKAATYHEVTDGAFKIRAYLEEIKSKANRRMLARIRTGSHILIIETGRWAGEALSSRVCPNYSSGAIENEYHFIFECPTYGEIRSTREFICLFKAPWSLETVLEDNSPLICEYMSLCLELREAHLA
jgi:hypothetical protein